MIEHSLDLPDRKGPGRLPEDGYRSTRATNAAVVTSLDEFMRRMQAPQD